MGLTKLKKLSVEVEGTNDHNIFELFEDKYDKLNDEIYNAQQKEHIDLSGFKNVLLITV